MLAIKYLTMKMEEELKDAEKYTVQAIKYKDNDSILAETLHSIAAQELEHYNKLHEQATRIIEETKQKKEIPKNMMEKYDRMHEYLIKRLKDVKAYMDLY